MAYELQAAKIQQKIRNEEIQIQVRVKSCDDHINQPNIHHCEKFSHQALGSLRCANMI